MEAQNWPPLQARGLGLGTCVTQPMVPKGGAVGTQDLQGPEGPISVTCGPCAAAPWPGGR